MASTVQIFVSLQAPILALYLADKASNDLRHVGAIIAVYTFFSAISSSIASVSLIQYRYPLLIVSYAIYTVYSFLLFLEPSLYIIYILQAFGGIGSGVGWAAFVETFVHSVPKPQYTQYYSFNRLAGSIVGSLAAGMSGYIAHYLGVEHVFLFMSGISIVSLILAAVIWRIDSDITEATRN